MGAELLIALAIIVMVVIALFKMPRSMLRSLILGLSLVLVSAVFSLGAWYAWAESNSLPWTLGYGTLAAIALSGAARQFLFGSTPGNGDSHPA